MTFKVVGNLDPTVMEDLQTRTNAKVADAIESIQEAVGQARALANPPLLTVVVEDGEPLGTQFPTTAQFPGLPEYLRDIEGPFQPRTVAYEMSDRGNLEKVKFSICGKPYDPSCVNQTLKLDVPEEWTLTNNSNIAHPFHIHVNPFQLVSDVTGTFQPPYVWRDTIPIPTGTPEALGKAVIRYEAKEFTGEWVHHCHILGHEDRGMMHNVQATCENGQWGRPTSDLSPECREGNLQPAAPQCAPDSCQSGN